MRSGHWFPPHVCSLLLGYPCLDAGSGSHIIMCVNIVCEEIQHIGGQDKFFFSSVLRPFQAFSLISRRINR